MIDPNHPADDRAAATDDEEPLLLEAVEEADDPGGAHAKGYSADPPGTEPKLPAEPYRLSPES
jgi:hypothetical protein